MRKLLLAACAAGALLWADHAQALVITVTGEDNLGNNLTNSGGSPVLFNNSVGSWSAIGTAQGTPPLPLGELLSNTIDVNTGAAGTFTLWVTENGLTAPLGNVPFFSSLTTNQLNLNGGAVTSVKETTSLQANNSTPGIAVPLGTILDTATFTASNQVQTSTLAALTGAGPYSLTEQYIITATGPGNANLTIDLTAVPEPASLALLGAGLVGFAGFMARRRRRNNVAA
jgi:hypothetical protein